MYEAPSYQRRIAVLPEMDPWSASTRYRALQHVPRLRKMFESVDVWIPRDTIVRDPGRVGQIRYFATHARRYVERAVEVRRVARGYDGLLVQRGLYAVGPGTIVSSL